MRALLYNRLHETFNLTGSWPVPKPRFENDEHLLKVHSIAITKGELLWPFPEECYRDYSPGVEMAGTVVACPPGSKFSIGSEVYMRTTSPRSGSTREYTIGLGKELAYRPRNLSAEEAASIPVSALTAWQALFEQANLPVALNGHQANAPAEQRRRVLIIGASGSVGIWATQFARAAGFWVAGICHTKNVAMVRGLGADEIIDYTQTTIREWIEDRRTSEKFDLVFDCVGGSYAMDSWYAAHPDHGLVLSIVPSDDMVFKWTLDRPDDISAKVKGRFFIMYSNGEHLQKISELVEAGKMKPLVDSVFELEDYKQAFERVDSRLATGKVVIRITK